MKNNVMIYCILIVLICISIYFVDYKDLISNIEYYLNKNNEITLSNEMNDINYESNLFYYNNNLTEEQKNIYESISQGITKLETHINIYNYYPSDFKEALSDISKVLEVFLLDHPEVFYVENRFQIENTDFLDEELCRVTFYYTVEDKYELRSKIDDINIRIDKLYKGFRGKTDIEAVIYIYEYLSNNIAYDSDEIYLQESHTIEGLLMNELAVCDGYSKTMQILLKKAGIESVVVIGELDEVSHAWNMIKINGDWYHTDVTSSNIADNVVSHAYLNINETEILKTHVISNKYKIYRSDSTEMNYFIYKDLCVGSNLKSDLMNIIRKQGNSSYLEFKSNYFNNIEDITKALYDLDYNSISSNKANSINYYKVGDTYIILD